MAMAERSTDRSPSISSASTEAERFDDKTEKRALMSSQDEDYKLKTPEELEDMEEDIERAELLAPPPEEKAKAAESSIRSSVIWMVVNTLATIGIVSFSQTNKSQNFYSSIHTTIHTTI